MDWESIRNIAVTIFGLGAGGGGVVAWYKAHQDSKKGIRESDLAETVADTNYLERVIQLQTEALFTPLQNEVLGLRKDVRELNGRIDELEEEKFHLIRRADSYEFYIERLIDHVDKGLGPPAPQRPASLR